MIYVKDIIRLCDGELLCGDENLVLDNFSKDTRTIQKDDIYVGIKGENTDGNLFVEDAFSKGAKAAIIEHIDNNIKEKYQDRTIILVKDSIVALQELAKYKRSLCDIKVVAITGSVGKTSTKDMVASVLEKKYKVLKTIGNNNNHIGLPLTILRLKDEEVMVLEMGMNHFGELSLLTDIAKPTIGVITNIGTAHIGNLGSRENILKAKLEITEGLSGPLIINNDNDLLHNLKIDNKLITIGIDNKSDYNAYDILTEAFSSSFKINDLNIKINVGGIPFIYNSLVAYAVGKCCNIEDKLIKEGLENFNLTKGRLEVKNNHKGITIIDDTYNASFDSVKASLEILAKAEGKRKIALLGDILELGEYSDMIHKNIGKEVINNNIDILITIGNLSKQIDNEVLKLGFNKDNIYHFNSQEESYNLLDKVLIKGDVILLKGSHAMNLDNIVKYLIK